MPIESLNRVGRGIKNGVVAIGNAMAEAAENERQAKIDMYNGLRNRGYSDYKAREMTARAFNTTTSDIRWTVR